jgi:outer membrane protein assembly factor BamB
VATGKVRWLRRYNSGGKAADQGVSVGTFDGYSPVIVTARSTPADGRPVDTTLCYDALTGQQRWVRQYRVLGSNSFSPVALALQEGTAVGYVGGDTGLKSGEDGYGTVAFSLRTGAVLWRNFYTGPASGRSSLRGLALGGNRALYETGTSASTAGVPDYGTVAFADL